MKKIGVVSTGITCPIIREGDNLSEIITSAVLENSEIFDKDIIGITESIVARSQGNYATVDDIAAEITKLFGEKEEIVVINPIYSRNRFAMILKGIARSAKKIKMVMPAIDEVGNPSGVNHFTGVDIKAYYQEICASENCDFEAMDTLPCCSCAENFLYCGLHDYTEYKEKLRKCLSEKGVKLVANGEKPQAGAAKVYTLADICSDRCEFGVLGSNKANEETLKLFPKKKITVDLCYDIKNRIKEQTGKDVLVCVYGDGCFKDPVAEIWEFADPISMPAYTNPEVFESTPNELKVKALADGKFGNLSGEELQKAVENEISNKAKDLKGSMSSQGTTPRLYRDLLASLMDLTTGSGDRCTPIVLIHNYL